VRVAAHAGRDAQQHRLSLAAPFDEALQPIDVIEVVDRDQPDAGVERHLKLAVIARIAVKNES
jgi:hypothetical protein